MRKILIMALSGFFCGYVASEACANDDVYVDLSVLNDVGSSSSSNSTYIPTFAPSYIPDVVRTEPQFPVVKKSASRPVAKKAVKPAKKAVAKKSAAVKTEKKQGLKIKQVSVSDKEDKINIPAKPTDSTASLKISPAERMFMAGVDNGPFKAEVKVPSDKVSSAPIVPVKSETIEILQAEPAAEIAPEVVAPTEDKPGVSVLPAKSAPEVTDISVVSSVETPKPAEPLVPVTAPVLASVSSDISVGNGVVFAEDSSELSETAKANVDNIIASFENAKANKIAILAYNYDNGQDVFRKKRQSLNRAVEIRSYLLGKGYKNFSIKVVNISDDATRGNVVDIEEIK